MAKSPAERKKEQRARQTVAGNKTIEVTLDNQELEMLAQNCAGRRPGREPYDATEYIALLIRQDHARVRGLIKSISKHQCSKCGDQLPITECCLSKESACWLHRGWHELKLKI